MIREEGEGEEQKVDTLIIGKKIKFNGFIIQTLTNFFV